MDYRNFDIKHEIEFKRLHEIIKDLVKSNDAAMVSRIKKTIFDNEYLLYLKIKDEWNIDKRYPFYNLFIDESKGYIKKECNLNQVKGHNCSEISHRKVIYSNISRVLGSIEYIVEGKCEPLDVVEINDQYFIINGKHRYTAHLLLNKETFPANVNVLDYENEISKYILLKGTNLTHQWIVKADILNECFSIPRKGFFESKNEYSRKVKNIAQSIWYKLEQKTFFNTKPNDERIDTLIKQFGMLEIDKIEFINFLVEKSIESRKEIEFELYALFIDIARVQKNNLLN